MEKNLSFEKFEEIMLFLQRYNELSEKIDEISDELCADFPPLNLFGLAEKHTGHIVGLLKYMFDDETEYSNIDYWIYELEYGKKYKKDCITERDGTEIKLGTIKELYDFLISEKSKEIHKEVLCQ